MREELAYTVPLGIPHSRFLSWDEDDQDKALAFMREKSKICQECGTRMEEWEANRDAYTPDAYRCPGCELLEQFRESVPNEQKGIKTTLSKRSPEEVGMSVDFGIQESQVVAPQPERFNPGMF